MSDERKNSILTTKLRKFIKGEANIGKSNPSTYRARIRERVESSMIDFLLLFEHMEQDQVRKTFGSNAGSRAVTNHQKVGEPDIQELGGGKLEEFGESKKTAAHVPFVIAFLLRGLNYGEERLDPTFEDMPEDQPAFTHFKRELEQGIRIYLKEERNQYANVDVTIDLDIRDTTDNLIEKEDTSE